MHIENGVYHSYHHISKEKDELGVHSHHATPKDKDDPDVLMYGGERSVKAGLHLESRYPDRAHDDASSDHTNKSKQRSYKHMQGAIIQVLYRRKNCDQRNIHVGFHTGFVKSSTVCQNGARLSVQTSDPIFDHRLFNSTYWARLIFCHLFFTYRCFSRLGQGARLVYELNLSKHIHICGLDFLFQQGYDS